MFLGEGIKVRPARKADNFTTICESTVYKMWEPRRPKTHWASAACYGDSFIVIILDIFLVLCHNIYRNMVKVKKKCKAIPVTGRGGL
jgi:hypothetical protein